MKLENKKDKIDIIESSHRRSIYYGIKKSRIFPKKILNPEETINSSKKNEKLLNIASRFMRTLYDFL
ncbi:hypothetical protein [Clostridium sp. JS66]|uniref:hypothetical protein n=1 Tax=Clostridium sp. JS66 TaxID=3064705 RepID=UPI00298DCEF1|nr:hypothetical protein [Clostridium sp. JS66]WPC43350.1 hypothetical protein Q6H37_07730 [Clostridium sp. JS66]